MPSKHDIDCLDSNVADNILRQINLTKQKDINKLFQSASEE